MLIHNLSNSNRKDLKCSYMNNIVNILKLYLESVNNMQIMYQCHPHKNILNLAVNLWHPSQNSKTSPVSLNFTAFNMCIYSANSISRAVLSNSGLILLEISHVLVFVSNNKIILQ